MICTKIFLTVLAYYLSITIFNSINFVRSMDIVYGKTPMNWRKVKTIIRRTIKMPINVFLYEFILGMCNFDEMVKITYEAKQRVDREKGRS